MTRRRVSLYLGPLLAVVAWCLPLPVEMAAHRLAGLFLWVVCWWMGEAIPLAATALLLPCLLVIMGVAEPKQAFAPFAHPLIFLFLGGFIIARAMRLHKLDRRFALFLLTLPGIRGRPFRMISAMLVATVILSMWISNTATAAMMLPITLSVAKELFETESLEQDSLLIAVAYCASLGGLATPVGSPPNVIAIGMLDKLAGVSIGFLEWMGLALPIVVVSTGAVLVWLYRGLPPISAQFNFESLASQRRALGTFRTEEKQVLLVLSLAILFWIGPGIIALVLGKHHGLVVWFRGRLPEGVVAMVCALLLFVFSSKGRPTLSWKEAVQIDWAALLLFGGGLSLGAALFETGLATEVGGGFMAAVGNVSPFLFLVAIVFLCIFFTECASNTASANLLIPLVIGASQAAGWVPTTHSVSVAMACSLAFMLPVATPPNAIFYGSGKVRLSQMMRMGFFMNLVCGSTLVLWMWWGSIGSW